MDDFNFKAECIAKSETIRKYQLQVADLEHKLMLKNREIQLCIREKQEAEQLLLPTKKSLDAMTAEHGKLLRKIKRGKC